MNFPTGLPGRCGLAEASFSKATRIYLGKIAQHPLVQGFDVSFMMLLLYSLGAEKRAISLIVINVTAAPCA